MSGTIFLGAEEISVDETQGFLVITVERTGDLSQPVTVQYSITGGSAVAGQDFIGVTTATVTIAAGADRVQIPVTIIDDSLFEATETLVVSIINVSSGVLQAPRTARISILDDENPVTDPPDPPLVSSYAVSEIIAVAGLSEPIDMVFAPALPSAPPGSRLAFVAEKGGVIKVVDTATGTTVSTFIDISSNVNSDLDRGLLHITLHPDFATNPYLYAFYVVDPPDSAAQTGNAGLDGAGNRFAYVVRFTADAANGYLTAVPGSETILVGGAGRALADISGAGAIDSTSDIGQAESGRTALGGYVNDYIKVDSRSHAGGGLAFGPDGALYVSIGDGTSFNFADPRSTSVQSLDSLSGKILRIDPITGQGLADNPFVETGTDLASNRARVYQMGLRNPFSISFDANGALIVTDTGWFSYEEINVGPAGANFGWPFFEGGDNGTIRQAPNYQDLPEAAPFYQAVTAGLITITSPYRAFSHNTADPGFQGQAIVGGDVVYTGNRYPAVFQNDYFFSDFSDGEVYSVDMNDRRDVTYLYTTPTGLGPVDFTQGSDGYIYYVDIVRGHIGRLDITPATTGNRPPVAADDVVATTPLATGTLDVLANDADPDGPASALLVTAVNGLAAGVGQAVAGSNGGFFTILSDGTMTFAPAGGFAELVPDATRFSEVIYTVADTRGGTATATARATITAPGTATGSLILINARGDMGTEQLQLLIDDVVVATFNGVSTTGEVLGFRARDTGVTPGRVKIAFTNDVYDPANGVDSNLFIPSIVIDGQVYRTDSPTVFSTGTWLPADGFGPGFGRGEVLGGNGYFLYGTPPSPGSTITITARGDTGAETMQLLIDGQVVATFDNVRVAGGLYSYRLNDIVTADRVRVAFTNDVYDPERSLDYNLVVDRLSIDGRVFETEHPSVLSTGTWLPADGLVPGFGRGEMLNTNGYFQYAELTARPPVISSNGGGPTAAISVAENGTTITTVTATDPDPGTSIAYRIGAGADATRFAINAVTGVLTFLAAPNFEAPADAGTNNVYDVIVEASDGVLLDTQAIAVTVTNAQRGARDRLERRQLRRLRSRSSRTARP